MFISYREKVNREVAFNKKYAEEALIEMDALLDRLFIVLRDGGTEEELDYYIKELIVIREILYDVKYFR